MKQFFILLLFLVLVLYGNTAQNSQYAAVGAYSNTPLHETTGEPLLLAQNDTGISADVDTVTTVVKDAVQTAPKKGSPLNQWWVWVSGVVLAGFGLVTYFKRKYKKRRE